MGNLRRRHGRAVTRAAAVTATLLATSILSAIPARATAQAAPAPVATAATDPSGWYAIAVHRDRAGTSVPAVNVVRLAAYDVTPADLAARGITAVPFGEVHTLTNALIGEVGVAQDVLDEVLMPSESVPTGSGGFSAMSGGNGAQLAVYYDQTVMDNTVVPDNAWSATVGLFQSQLSIPLNRMYLMTGSSVPDSDVTSACDMQTIALHEMGFAGHADGVVIYSDGNVDDGGSFWGLQSNGTLSAPYARGESPDECVSGGIITPAVIPAAYIRSDLPTEYSLWTDGTHDIHEVLSAHEVGHMFGSVHGHAKCWNATLPSVYVYKTIEAMTSDTDTPAACGSNTNPRSKYRWEFNGYAPSAPGTTAMSAEWTRYANCRTNGWCTTNATPSAVRNLQASPNQDGSVTLTWDPPQYTGSSALWSYCYYIGTAAAFNSQESSNNCVYAPSTTAVVPHTQLAGGQQRWFYVRARNQNLTNQGPRSNIVGATSITQHLTGITFLTAPTSIPASTSAQVCWQVNGAGAILQTGLHWGPSSSPYPYDTAGQSGSAPSSFCDTITAPSSGTVYYQAYAYGPADSAYSYHASAAVTANLVATLYQYPTSVEPNSGFTVCWSVEGSGPISHTDLHYGTSSAVPNRTITRSGTAPNSFCESITSASSGTMFVQAHAQGNTESYSGQVQIPIQAPPSSNDCGTGGDAGGSHAAATSITLPKSNCSGSLATTTDEDWYQFFVTSGDTINASMTPNASSDYDICLYTQGGTYVNCSAAGTGATDTLTHTSSESGWYRLRVYRWSGGTGSYTLSVSTTSPQNDCGSGADGGSSHATATTIALPTSNCSAALTSTSDEDWYQFSVTAGQTINASMTPNASSNFDICLYTPSNSYVTCTAAGTGATDTFAQTAAVTGWYRVRVIYFSGGTGSYTMSVSASSGQNDCGTGGDAGNSHAAASAISLPKSNCSATLSATTDEDWYQFSVLVGQTINASMTPNASSDYDICLYKPDGSTIGCTAGTTGSTDTISHFATVSGSYRARVIRFSGPSGSYTMSISV